MPAKAGIQKYLKTLDRANGCALRLEKMHYVPRLRGNDNRGYLTAGVIIAVFSIPIVRESLAP